jgi:hypothetical protein
MHSPRSAAAVIAADLDDLIPKYGGSAANTKGQRKLFFTTGPRYSCGDTARLLPANHESEIEIERFLGGIS